MQEPAKRAPQCLVEDLEQVRRWQKHNQCIMQPDLASTRWRKDLSNRSPLHARNYVRLGSGAQNDSNRTLGLQSHLKEGALIAQLDLHKGVVANGCAAYNQMVTATPLAVDDRVWKWRWITTSVRRKAQVIENN